MKKALIIGMGVSGKGAAKLLTIKGYDVYAYDQVPFCIPQVKRVPILSESILSEMNQIVISPGVDNRLLRVKLKRSIGEAELGIKHLQNTMIAITGTNGKTELTLLITHIFNHCGMKAVAIGNIGKSIADYACSPDLRDILVIELSSFQIETLYSKKIDYGIITNITKDHLDRYRDFQHYYDTKQKLKEFLKKGDLITESTYNHLLDTDKIKDLGSNTLSKIAWKLTSQFGIGWKQFLEALDSFKRPGHRLELFCEINGRIYINDSKSTNLASLKYALKRIEGPKHLIVGGKDKQTDLLDYKISIGNDVKGIYAIGETASLFQKALPRVETFSNLEEAVLKAQHNSVKGDSILLSPGASSLDQFDNYEERGNTFKNIVYKIKENL